MNIHLLLNKIRNHLASSGPFSQDNITQVARSNIRKIRQICNIFYANQSYCGASALNRKILLDEKIAELLTPETILAILYLHIHTKNLTEESEIAVKRDSTGFASLASVLFYGFSEGLEAIRFMPTNSGSYALNSYQRQKENYVANTTKIISSIKEVASTLGIPFVDEQNLPVNNTQSLTTKFDEISAVIDQIKQHRITDKLLYVPRFTAEEIQEQSVEGFETICRELDIRFKTSWKGSIIVDSITLDEFVHAFISNPAVMLEDYISHVFYDRVHLEACIVSEIQVIFKDKKCLLRDILREMILKCESAEEKYETAKEQFNTRLNLVKLHIENKFQVFCNSDVQSLAFQHIQPGYINIIRIMREQQKKLEECQWDFMSPVNVENEISCLQFILDQYDASGGTKPLLKCAEDAEKKFPEAYNRIIANYGNSYINFILSMKLPEISDPDTVAIYQGPRNKSLATHHLEYIVHAILLEPDSVNITQFDSPIEIIVNGRKFNLSAILEARPDFEQLDFTDKHFQAYLNFKKNPVCNLYSHPHLHDAEKHALHHWTTYNYDKIQELFHEKRLGHKYNNGAFNIILDACIAARALSRPMDVASHHTISYRGEAGTPALIADRNKAIQRKILVENEGFTATAHIKGKFYREGKIKTDFAFAADSTNPLGKNIDALSSHPENEILFSPNLEVLYVKTLTGYKAFPLRSVNKEWLGTGALYQHEFSYDDLLEIENEHSRIHPARIHANTAAILPDPLPMLTMLLNYLQKEKRALNHTWALRLFDTVDNDLKQICLHRAISAVDKIMKEKITPETLQAAAIEIKNASIAHLNAVSQAKVKSKPGKTGDVLCFAEEIIQKAMLFQTEREKLLRSFPKEIIAEIESDAECIRQSVPALSTRF